MSKQFDERRRFPPQPVADRFFPDRKLIHEADSRSKKMFFEIRNPFRPDSNSSAVRNLGAVFRKLEYPYSNVALSLAGRIAEISDANSNLLIHFAPLFFTETGVFLTQSTPIFGESLHLPRSYGPQIGTSDQFPCQIRTFWARQGVFFSIPNHLEPNQQRGEVVMLVRGFDPATVTLTPETSRLLARLAAELPPRRAAAEVADLTGLPARQLYQWLLDQRHDS